MAGFVHILPKIGFKQPSIFYCISCSVLCCASERHKNRKTFKKCKYIMFLLCFAIYTECRGPYTDGEERVPLCPILMMSLGRVMAQIRSNFKGGNTVI